VRGYTGSGARDSVFLTPPPKKKTKGKNIKTNENTKHKTKPPTINVEWPFTDLWLTIIYLYWCLQFLIYSSFSELVGAGIHW
jgi:hypothetical protein